MLGRFFNKVDRRDPPAEHGESSEPSIAGTVQIDGTAYPLASWSEAGFLATDYTGDRKAREKLEVTVSLALDDGDFGYTTPAMLVRVDRDSRKVVGSFVDMDTSLRIEIARRFRT